MEVADQVAATRGEADLAAAHEHGSKKLNFTLADGHGAGRSLVDRLLALMDETRRTRTRSKPCSSSTTSFSPITSASDTFRTTRPQRAPPGTLDVLVSPRGLAIFAGPIRRRLVRDGLVDAIVACAATRRTSGPYCRAIAGSAVVDAILEVVSLDAAGARAWSSSPTDSAMHPGVLPRTTAIRTAAAPRRLCYA